MRLTSVVLPEPVAPTIASVEPAGTSSVMSWSTGRLKYPKLTFSNSMLPRISGSGVHARRVGDGGLAGQHLLDALHRGGGLLVHVQRPAEVHHRHREQHDVAVELHELRRA